VNRHRPSISTVFSSRWILIDRRYRPWSIDRVDKSVDRYRHLDSCWDHYSPPTGPWLFCRCVSGTISDHLWDHKGPQVNGPFFPDFSEECGRAQRPRVWSVTRGSASEQWHQKGRVIHWIIFPLSTPPWNTLDPVSIVLFVGVCLFLSCVSFCEKRLKWVRVNRSERLSQSYTSFLLWSMGE